MRRLMLAMIALCTAAPAMATDFTPQLENFISGYIRPSTAEFASTAAALPGAVSAVCEKTDDASAERFRETYTDTVLGFARIHFLRFGPLLEGDRLTRLAFMPDPRNAAQRQIRRVYGNEDASVLSVDTLKDKSVALQGLTALQLIAFGKTGDVRLGEPGDTRDFTCEYALAIAQNVAAVGEAVARDWADPDGYSRLLLTAGPDNERFRTSKEAIETVFNALVTGIIIVRDQDLLPALGSSQKGAKPNRFPFSRSGNGIAFISEELSGIRDGVASLKLEGLVAEEFEWIFGAVSFEFDNAQGYLDNLQPPLRATFGDGESYGRVTVLAITLKSIRDTLALELAGALGLAGGFNALDGD
ncbi:imelysin family protein [Labrenzia aggregata]|uniref:Imelysin family protein n=1 Tax=Roseibium aggregatum TaxID=187304 RepID=A0A939J653_9HYPH|nr:imelysin family protein [Roseibium aggregatum]